jgi:hypothetical protein
MPPLRFMLVSACLAAALAAQTPSGEEVYKQRSAGCHSQDNPRVPPRALLEKMPASHIELGIIQQAAIESQGR